MIYKALLHIEVIRLFPNALELLSENEWKEMHSGDKEIGWMLAENPTPYPTIEPDQDNQQQLPFSTKDRTLLNEGFLTCEQLNLLLQFLPVDITCIDENDIIDFYNRGDDRILPLSSDIIGKEVQFCFPTMLEDHYNKVLSIINHFKAGLVDNAVFCIDYQGKKFTFDILLYETMKTFTKG